QVCAADAELEILDRAGLQGLAAVVLEIALHAELAGDAVEGDEGSGGDASLQRLAGGAKAEITLYLCSRGGMRTRTSISHVKRMLASTDSGKNRVERPVLTGSERPLKLTALTNSSLLDVCKRN